MLKKLKKINSELVKKNPWWEYKMDKCYIPNGREYEYHYVHTGGSVMVAPLMENGTLILVKQYRYLNKRFSIEFPAGGMKPGQNPDLIAHKELIEETGYDGEIKKAGFFNPYNGVTDEYCYVYTASNLQPSEKETKDEQEEFELLFLLPDEIERMIVTNEIHDGMTMAVWSILRNQFLK